MVKQYYKQNSTDQIIFIQSNSNQQRMKKMEVAAAEPSAKDNGGDGQKNNDQNGFKG